MIHHKVYCFKFTIKFIVLNEVSICISLKAPRGLPIHRLEVKYRFFVHLIINKTNRIKENNIFLKKIFCHGVDLFRNRPYCTLLHLTEEKKKLERIVLKFIL